MTLAAIDEDQTEYVIAATMETALICAHLIREGKLPRVYADSIAAIQSFNRQPDPMKRVYRLYACNVYGAATVLT